MIDSTTQAISILLITFTMAVSVIVTQFIRRRRSLFALRPIPAYQSIPLMVGESIEANRPLHLSMGSASIGGGNTLLALVSAELFYQVAQRAAIGDASPIITVSDSSAIPLGQDTLRRAYQSRDLLNRFRYSSVRWYPSGGRSLAFAAALTAVLGDDTVSGNVLVGSFGPELGLIMEAVNRRNLTTIAASDQLEGQAIAYALSEQSLIGEEIFTANAYLEGAASPIAGLVTTDILRWLLVLAMLAATVVAIINRGG